MLYELAERPRILLIGADGQLGWELRRSAAPRGGVVATVENDSRRRNVAGALLNLADHGAIRRVVADVKPHVILNAAAVNAAALRITWGFTSATTRRIAP